MQWGLSQRNSLLSSATARDGKHNLKYQITYLNMTKSCFSAVMLEYWNVLPEQSVSFSHSWSYLTLIWTVPYTTCCQQEGWTRVFPDIATNLNHCVILWFHKKALLIDTLWLTLVPCLWLQIWEMPAMPAKMHSSTFPLSQQLPAHTPLSHPKWALLPASRAPQRHTCDPGSRSWRLPQLEQLLSRGAPAGTEGSQSQAQAGIHSQNVGDIHTHHCCWGQKCAVCPGHRTDIYEYQKQGWENEADFKMQDKCQLDLKLEKHFGLGKQLTVCQAQLSFYKHTRRELNLRPCSRCCYNCLFQERF